MTARLTTRPGLHLTLTVFWKPLPVPMAMLMIKTMQMMMLLMMVLCLFRTAIIKMMKNLWIQQMMSEWHLVIIHALTADMMQGKREKCASMAVAASLRNYAKTSIEFKT